MKNKLPNRRFLLAFVTSLFLFTSSGMEGMSQTTIFVNSLTGNDATGNGTISNPYKTFHKGYTMAASGNILDLTGTFTWTDTDETGDVAVSGYVLTKRLTIQGQGPEYTIIQAAETSNTADRRVFTFQADWMNTSITLKNLTIKNGKCNQTVAGTTSSGGVHIKPGMFGINVTVSGCVFENNILTGNAEYSSGALSVVNEGSFNSNSNLFTIDKCYFKNNSTSQNYYGGGAVYVGRYFTSTITNSTFYGNQASKNQYYWIGNAGALFVDRYGATTITNCTFTGNSTTAGDGGAMILWDVTATLTNNTIAQNYANDLTSTGAGLRVECVNASYPITLKNNIIANNISTYMADRDFYKNNTSTVTDNGFNIVEYSSAYTFNGTGSITGEQVHLFGTYMPSTPALAVNNSASGVPTLALSAGSVAINAGSNTANGTVTIPAADQRFYGRNGSVDIGAFKYEGTTPTTVWTGQSVSPTDWGVLGNWTLGVPNSSLNASIPGSLFNYPIVSGAYSSSNPALCNNLTLENGASLTVESGKALTINGTLTNQSGASLTVNSGGSLLTNGSVTGNISIKREITGSTTLTANKYHLVSIPLATSNASSSSLFLGSYLFSYLPSENSWLPMGTETTTNLDETLGYMIYYPGASITYTFTGQPNTGTFTPTVTYAGNSGGNNFALVPNPYPSNIDWNASQGWAKPNIGNSIWVYNNGNYAIWDGSNSTNGGARYIAVGQAFFVQTTAANPVLVMDNRVRTHTSAAFLKNNVVPANQLRVKALANNMQDEIIAGFADGKSAAFDPLEDALKLFGAEDAPQLYTLAGDSKVSINQLAELNGSAAVPLYFETEFNGEVNFEFSQLESFPADLKIRLEDKLTGQWVNLRETTEYLFTHNPTNTAERFILHFGSAAGIDKPANSSISSWFSSNTFYLSTTEHAGEKAKVEIFSISGQLLFSRELTLSNMQQLNLNAKGSVVTRITLDNKVLNTKAIVL